MTTVNIHEVGADLPSLVERALAGEDVILAKDGKPVARLIPYPSTTHRRIADRYAGQVHLPPDFERTSDDLIDDFEKGGPA